MQINYTLLRQLLLLNITVQPVFLANQKRKFYTPTQIQFYFVVKESNSVEI